MLSKSDNWESMEAIKEAAKFFYHQIPLSEYSGFYGVVAWGGSFSFFWNIHVPHGWHLHLHKTYNLQNSAVGTCREIDSLVTNQVSI